jgi:hypothetical protein
MATLYNTKISATYPGLIKTTDNAALTATLKELTDGSGNASGLYANTAGDFKVTAILEWGSLKDTGSGVTITQWVTSADGIENFNNNTSVPTSAAVKTYVDAVVTASDLDFLGDTGFGAVDLDSQDFSIEGTLKQITTLASNQTIKLSLPNNVEISGVFEGTTFVGDLNGTINTDTTAVTQTAGDNSTKVATTAYVDTLDAASDLDFTGDSGTGDVNLNTQSLAITGTTNQIVTAAVHQGLSLSLPATVHRDLQGNVTGNVTGDLTGNVTATSVLASGVTATTQTAGDNSTKIATTAYVDVLDAASDLDITGDSGTGDVNLNTQTLNILGTANEITTAVVNQTATISLPSSISVDVIGNVTGDLTGNADTASAWQTARDLSLTGQATATLSNVDGALAVSGAVTLDNNSVTAKVLTGLPTPAAASVLATDSIVEGIGKLQSQINGLANGLQFQGSWDADTNSPVLSSGGGEATNGTTTSTSASKLVDSAANFTATVTVGDQVVNQVDGQTALVTNVDSSTILSIDADIMLSGETYTIDNTPFLTQGHYYVVSVGGAHTLNGVSNWSVGDWVIAGANNEWTQLDHTDVEGTGTAGNIAKWSATGTIADSIMAESGAAITVTGTLSTTTNLNSGSNFAVATDKFTANATTGAVAFEGDLAINTDKFTVNATSGNTLVAGTLDVTDTLIVNKSASAAVEIAQFKVDGTGGTNGNFSYVSILPGSGNFATQLRLHTNNTGSAYQSISNNVGVLELATNNSNPMVFKTNSVTRLTISNTGNATFTGTISGVGILSDGSTAVTQSAADASTKVATTAYADAAATAVPIGDYLPLIGGTLTGALTGTSATFAGNVNVGGTVTSPAGVGTIMGVVGRNGVGGGTAGIVLKDYDNDGWDIWNSGGGLNFRYNNDASVGFGISSSGAATFAGSVTGQVNSNTFGTASASGRALIVQSGSSNQAIMLKNNLGGDGTISATGTATSMNYQFGTYSTGNALFIQNDGNVGIGVTPNFALQVSGTNKNIQLGASTTVTTSNDIRHIFSGSAHFIGQDSLGEANIGNNVYYDSGFKRRNTGLASNIRHNAGNIYIQTGASAAADTAITWVNAMTIDNYGGVGINIVPEGNWITTTNVLQIGKAAAFWGTNNSNNAYISNNMFVNTNGNNHSLYAGGAAQYRQSDNIHLWYTSNVASAGNEVITLSEKMRITSGGNLVIKGQVNPQLYFESTTSSATMLGIVGADYTASAPYNANRIAAFNSSHLAFETGSAERMRITSGGDVEITGTYPVFSVTGTGSVGSTFKILSSQDGIGRTIIGTAGQTRAMYFENDGKTVHTEDSYFDKLVYGIGIYNNTTASAANMHVSSAGGQMFRSTSSLKYKTDVRDYDKGLNEVMQLQPKYYKGKDDGDTQFAGLIAEDVHELGLTEFVQYAEDGTPDALAYSHMIALLTKSIQELKAEVDLLKSNKCNCKN